MTQHLLPEHAEEDRRTMKRLGAVIGAFIVFTAVLAISVGIAVG